jgi:acetylornithine/succinyldiaminopimelate/putrescine aminotransferase
MNQRELFLRHVAQTSPAPLGIEIVRAEGCHLFGPSGEQYIDLIGGISVANTGHRHPRVIEAVKEQLDAYMHVMIYGEVVQRPQVRYAELLTSLLPASLNSVYFTNSGAEAVEGSMKLAKRATGRTSIAAFKNSYHGSTQGALSIIGDEYWRNSFRPLLPGIVHLEYNSFEALEEITTATACVVVEAVQAEAGIRPASKPWMTALRQRCTDTGTLLVLDEIQTGFGRTGKLWAFQHFDIVPDILLLGKALGGGMPLGAFIANKSLTDLLTDGPVLGHITTFGGHPVSCAAGLAALKVLLDERLVEQVKEKEALFRSLLQHPAITAIRSFGLWLSVDFDSFESNKGIIDECFRRGVLTDWFLFNSAGLRISPPLIISPSEITTACDHIVAAVTQKVWPSK